MHSVERHTSTLPQSWIIYLFWSTCTICFKSLYFVHTVLLLWCSEQTAIIYLQSIKWLATECRPTVFNMIYQISKNNLDETITGLYHCLAYTPLWCSTVYASNQLPTYTVYHPIRMEVWTWRFITMFTRARHMCLQKTRIQSTPQPPSYFFKIQCILRSHQLLRLPSGFLSSGFPTKTL